MLEGLLAAHRRYDELSAQLSQPDAAADLNRYRALMKEYKELEPLSRQYLALAAAEEALAEAKELLKQFDALTGNTLNATKQPVDANGNDDGNKDNKKKKFWK